MIIRDGYTFRFTRRNKYLKVACILDEFSYNSFKYECELLQISPELWETEMNNFAPDFLLIESAWQGKDDSWGGRLITAYDIIGKVIRYCARKAIPVVFWNKEDPYGYETFLDVARLSDVVFTTAKECVEKYKQELGHQNVYFMHFAVQPKLFDSHVDIQRKDKFCFAGSYYKDFVERNKIFSEIYKALDDYKGVDIYDRFYADKKRRFPKQYKKSVLGYLKYDEIYKAYYGYKYNINVNTVTDSETMFARRVFELMYSKSLVVSNYSKGLINYFGDLVISTNDTMEMIERLEDINGTKYGYDDYVNRGFDRVMRKELYSHRIEQICEVLFT